jgi:hypothetical protein
MNDQSTATADDGVVGTLDAWPKIEMLSYTSLILSGVGALVGLWIAIKMYEGISELVLARRSVTLVALGREGGLRARADPDRPAAGAPPRVPAGAELRGRRQPPGLRKKSRRHMRHRRLLEREGMA